MVTRKDTGTVGDFFESYGRILGLMMLGYVLIMLFSTPSMIIARSVTTIGTELSYASADELPVRTRLDLGNTEHLKAFPQQIGEWTGYDYETTSVKEALGADVMLMRAYEHPKWYQPVFFLIMQSRNRTSFHPPIVCYPALGYTIEEEGRELVTVQNTSWVEDPWFSAIERRNETVLPVKKLVIAKNAHDTGEMTERRVVLYFYVKNAPLSSDSITMVRVDAFVPTDCAYDGILTVAKEFMGKTIPCMFEVVQRPERRLFSSLATGSIAEKLMLILLFLAPLPVIFYPELRTLAHRWTRT
ncbi:MAG: exosortase-associated EpsI family protein [Methanomicrobia archaeon]|nr:exosortase-associated EpsI family protein [Methanomicrobia archaeon]